MWSLFFPAIHMCKPNARIYSGIWASMVFDMLTNTKKVCVVVLGMVKRHAQCHSANCSSRNSLCSTMLFAEYLRALQLLALKSAWRKYWCSGFVKVQRCDGNPPDEIEQILVPGTCTVTKGWTHLLKPFVYTLSFRKMNVLHYLCG